MRLLDGARSRAVLIGASRFVDPGLPDIPAVRRNLVDLAEILTSQGSTDLPPQNCTVLMDEANLATIGDRLEAEAEHAEDVLLVYYAGHGLVDAKGELHLSVPTTRRDRLRWTALPFSRLRELLADSRAKNRILILDCCFSGRAIDTMTDPESTIAGTLDIAGTYTLASTAANSPAHAPTGATHTAFTGELITLLRTGHPTAPELLPLRLIYQHLRHTLRTRGLPLPQQRGTDTADLLALTRNPAYGKPANAAATYEDVVIEREETFGTNHPHTLASRQQLAQLTGQSGDLAEAIGLLEQVVADRTRVLGPLHPDTLLSRHDLANWTGEAGNAAAARELMRSVVDGRARVLGEDHLATVLSRHDLASWTGEAGNPGEAAELLRRVVAERERILGADHPYTLLSRNNRAYWVGEAGYPGRGAELMAQVVVDRERVLGPDHPETLFSRQTLGYLNGLNDKPETAAALIRQLAADRERVLGPDHPDTLLSRHSHAYWTGRAGNPARAVELMRQVVTDRARALGDDHPQTLLSRYELARLIAASRT